MSDLAINGGNPVRNTSLPYGKQCLDETDIESVVQVLRSDWLTTGPKVAEFEEAFAERVGTRYAVAVNSGTAALHAAVCAAGVGPEDEVIVPPLTFAASANCVRYQGGTVVFADVCPDTLLLDPQQVLTRLTPRSKAIITVDYTGQPSYYDELKSIADQYGLCLIADACHALGASQHGQPVGSLADMSTFSLHPVKHITSGEGGVITTDNLDFAMRMRRFRNHGITSDHRQREATGSWSYEMIELGYNYRLTDFQSALAQSQLGKLSDWVARRREIAAVYLEELEALPEIELPVTLPDSQPAWHLFVIRLNLEQLRSGRAEIFRAMRAENIGVNVHYIPVPWHPYYQTLGYERGQWPVTESAYERMLSLPIWPGMNNQDIADVLEACKKVISHYRR